MDDGDPLPSAAKASLWAGPIFTLTIILVTAMEMLPQPITNPLPLGLLILSLLVAVMVGAVITIIPALIATSLLGLVATHFPLLRPLPVWLAVGAALILLPAFALESPTPVLYALTLTAMATAARCHSGWRWE